MNEEGWGFYVPLEEEYFIKEKKEKKEIIELIERNLDPDVYIIRSDATLYESVCGIWRLVCIVIFRSHK